MRVEVISLMAREDRRQRAFARLRAAGFDDVRWFPATEGGEEGCTASHLALWERLVAEDATVLVLEDDAEFGPEFGPLLNLVLDELPADWDLLFLGGLDVTTPTPVSSRVARTHASMFTHAYMATPKALAWSLEQVRGHDAPLDVVWSGRMPALKVYRAMPWLVGQEDGWSDIEQSHRTGRGVPSPGTPMEET